MHSCKRLILKGDWFGSRRELARKKSGRLDPRTPYAVIYNNNYSTN